MDISLSYDHFSEYEPVPQSCKRPRSRTARSERNPTEFDLICRKRRLRELMPPVRVRKVKCRGGFLSSDVVTVRQSLLTIAEAQITQCSLL